MIVAIVIFALMYVGMLVFGKYRPYIALDTALIFIVSGMLPLDKIFGEIDFNVLLMIGGTMGLVELFIQRKMPNRLADLIMKKVPNIQWAAVCLSLFAGIISAFIDNIPYVATMIPVLGSLATGLATKMGIDATLIAIPLYFGLLSGATLGGNITPIGASANIAAIGILRKNGYEVKSSDFFKIGIPFTLAAIVPAYIYIWLVFGV